MADALELPYYIVLEGETTDIIAQAIPGYRSAGYELQGGISVTVYYAPPDRDSTYSHTQYWYAQAMVLKEGA